MEFVAFSLFGVSGYFNNYFDGVAILLIFVSNVCAATTDDVEGFISYIYCNDMIYIFKKFGVLKILYKDVFLN